MWHNIYAMDIATGVSTILRKLSLLLFGAVRE